MQRPVRLYYLQMVDFGCQKKRHVSVCLSRKIKITIIVLRCQVIISRLKHQKGCNRLLSIDRIRYPTQEAVFQTVRTVSGSVKLKLSELNTDVLTCLALFFHRQLAFNFCCLA